MGTLVFWKVQKETFWKSNVLEVCKSKPGVYTVSALPPPPPFPIFEGATFSTKYWKGGSEKNECLRGSYCHIYLHGRGLTVSCQRRLYKINNGFDGSISSIEI